MSGDPETPNRIARRAKMILRRAAGSSQEAVARLLKVNRPVVSQWEKRFRELGLEGLQDARGRGRQFSVTDKTKAMIVNAVGAVSPDQSRWTVRRMARRARVSVGTVHAIWKTQVFRPYVPQASITAGGQRNPKKSCWLAGVYLRPPTKALVLSCCPGDLVATLTHVQAKNSPRISAHPRPRDSKRPRWASFLAALASLERRVFSQAAPRNDIRTLGKFLEGLEDNCDEDQTLLLIINHRLPLQLRRIQIQMIPAKIRWLDYIESIFRQITSAAPGVLRFGGATESFTASEQAATESIGRGRSFAWSGNVEKNRAPQWSDR